MPARPLATLLTATARWLTHLRTRRLHAVIRTFTAPTPSPDLDSWRAFAIVLLSDGKTTTAEVFSTPRPQDYSAKDRNATALAGLDAFEFVHRHAAHRGAVADIHMHDEQLRDLLAPVMGSFPHCRLGGDSRRLADLTAECGALVSQHAGQLHRDHARALRNQKVKPVEVAADASCGPGYPGVGLACVCANGVTATRYVPEITNSLAGELAAVELALDTLPAVDWLVVLTDSQAAVLHLSANRPRAQRPDVAAIVARIDRKRAGRQVCVRWVRGHSGHPLNEAADRAALATRRRGQAAGSATLAA